MDTMNDPSRRGFIKMLGASLPLISVPGVALSSTSQGPLADTANGRLRGVYQAGVSVFKGVPYGGPLSGPKLRFKAPTPVQPWAGIRDAASLGAPSLQRAPGFDFGQPAPAEDCLFLNVWTPAADNKKRPVMVYQHGGGFVIGSGGAPWQDGAALAREHDVVVVQSNHRLGVMGYLYLGELLGEEYQGNQGLQDLVAALKWVSENIFSFGGDPDNVMIFGESGGGGKTSALYAMPSAAPYFHKASIESPIGPGDATPEQATEVTLEVMRRLNISDPAKLLTVPAQALLQAQLGNGKALAPGERAADGNPASLKEIMFWPFIDGNILPEEPFRKSAPAISADKPLMVGTCKDETVFFYQGDQSVFNLDEAGLKARLTPQLGDRTDAWIDTFRQSRPDATPSELFIAITTAKPWRAHAVHIAEQKARQGAAPVYSYILNYHSTETVPGTTFEKGSPHASDIPMKFNTAPQFGPDKPERLATASAMSTMWANFARTSQPDLNQSVTWKPYSEDKRLTMLINENSHMVADPEAQEREFFTQEPDADKEAAVR